MIGDPSSTFLYRLALALGGMTVEELGRRMGSRELAHWIAYDRINPLPCPNYSAGVIASVVHNSMTTGGKPTEPEDFMPRKVVKKAKAASPAAKARAFFGALAAAHERSR